MPELDFINMQIARFDARTLKEKAKDWAILVLCQSTVFGVFLIGIALEDAFLVTGFLLMVVLVAIV